MRIIYPLNTETPESPTSLSRYAALRKFPIRTTAAAPGATVVMRRATQSSLAYWVSADVCDHSTKSTALSTTRRSLAVPAGNLRAPVERQSWADHH